MHIENALVSPKLLVEMNGSQCVLAALPHPAGPGQAWMRSLW
jgi:hypothetical protein